jgi:hypothetical protein
MSSRSDDDPRESVRQSGYDPAPRSRTGYQRQSIAETAAKSFIRSVASSLGRALMRALLGRVR